MFRFLRERQEDLFCCRISTSIFVKVSIEKDSFEEHRVRFFYCELDVDQPMT